MSRMSSLPRVHQGSPLLRRPAHHTGWRGYRHAFLRSLYALLLVLVLLLPANFIAYALSYSTTGGSAIQGLVYAWTHHLAGYFVAAQGQASAVGAAYWWAGAVWEVLLWLSCASAVVLLVLWAVRLVLARLTRNTSARRTLTSARAA